MDVFSRTELLLGQAGMERLKKAQRRGVRAGRRRRLCGGGARRSGVGALDLVDNDIVSETNINRQIVALLSTVGKRKTEAAAARIKDVSPACAVRCFDLFVTDETVNAFRFADYDYVIEAIDTVSGKLAIVKACAAAKTPIVSCMGAGNKLDSTAFEVTDIYRTKVCPWQRLCSSSARKRH